MSEIATPSPTARPEGSRCPDEGEVLEFVEGRLAEGDARAIRAHLDGCEACREWVANVADELLDAPEPARAGDEPLRGTAIGRYTVLGLVGAGGMGAVYAAYDPELDRKVALKLLRADPQRVGDPERDRLRVQREAQAMARLNHPNVIAVYDVGTFERELFIAMEFVDGMTLRAWRRAQPRRWQEILDCYRHAGEGLAAAHRANLVHRDFKPDNVLVDAEGRVRVGDFGLARAPAVDDEATATTTASGRIGMSTATPAGTPAYMAPEQRIGDPIDARADQFSFCRALSEALLEQGETGAPRWLREALARGLQRDPAARWPSMDALLAVLRRDRARLRRRVLAAAGVIALAAAATTAGHHVGAPRCESDAAALAGAWDPPLRDALRARFAASERADAQATGARVEASLVDYAQAWLAMRTEVCEATHVRAEQSAELFDQRMACLERRRTRLASFTSVLAAADPLPLDEVVLTVGALPRIDDCADLDALAAAVPLPGDAHTRAAIAQGYAALDRAWARRYLLGDAEALIEPLTALVDDAQRLQYAPLEAKALSLLGDLHDSLGAHGAAEDALLAGITAAAAAHDDRTVGIMMIKLVALVGVGQRRFAEAELTAKLAEAALVRAASPDEDVAGLTSVQALLARLQGRPEQARGLHERTLALLDGAAGATPGERAGERSNFAATLMELGEHARAQQLLDEALALLEPELGPGHPVVAAIMQNIGANLEHQGEYERAIEATERARSIFAAAYGDEHYAVGDCLDNLAVSEHALGRLEQAQAHGQRAVEILADSLGDAHEELGDALVNLALVERDQGQCAPASAHLAHALRIAETVHGAASAASTRVRGYAARACPSRGEGDAAR